MRALLIVNPGATSTSPRTLDVLERALSSDMRLASTRTTSRGHATEIARQAVVDGYDVVIAHGGDGTVNEIVHGLLTAPGGPYKATELPMLGHVPGGSTNVFPRSLGLPNDPVEATGEILAALRNGDVRTIGVGHARGEGLDRHFTFNLGLGLDGKVIAGVEAKRRQGRKSTHGLMVRTALVEGLLRTDLRHPSLHVVIPGQPDINGLFMAFVSNARPWTFLGNIPVTPSPDASFDTGLDLFGITNARLDRVARTLTAMLSGEKGPTGPHVVHRHDLAEMTLMADTPQPLQMDGDFVGLHRWVTLHSVPAALRVLV